MIGKNKYLIISYKLACSTNNFSVTEKRILYRFFEKLQPLIKNKTFDKKYIEILEVENRTFLFEFKDFLLHESDNNYLRINNSLDSLSEKKIKYKDLKSGLITKALIIQNLHKVDDKYSIILSQELINIFIDFSKGARKIELKAAFDLRSKNAMKLYEMCAYIIKIKYRVTFMKSSPMQFKMDNIKMILDAEKVYGNRDSDFVRNIIQAAQGELNTKAPISFEFIQYKSKENEVGIMIKPTIILHNGDQKLLKKEYRNNHSLRQLFSKEFIEVLKIEFCLDEKGIKNNIECLQKFYQDENRFKISLEVNHMIANFSPKNKAGFFISELKKRYPE